MKSLNPFMRCIFLCIAIFFCHPAFALTLPDKPPSSSFYVDEAGLINAEDGAELNKIALKLLEEKRIPLFVVTIKSLESHRASGMSVEEYARELFDGWGIGYPEWNYGMLLLVSERDRKARIEFGKAWDHRHDPEAYDIMQNLIIPRFQSNDYSLGILEGVRGLDAVARGLKLPSPQLTLSDIIIAVAAFVAILSIAFSLFKNGRSGWAWAFLAGIGLLLFTLLNKSGGGKGGSGGSGSSGGFGGGSSGGGGATGSW